MITQLNGATTSQEALETANLNWAVATEPLTAQLGTGELVAVPRTNVVVRQDTKEVLGIVGTRYKVATNADIFNVADQVIARTGGFYDRAMSFKGNSQVLLQVKLPNTLTLGKDSVARYLTLSNSFDGSIALKAFVTPIRIACTNMVRMAMSKADNSITIRHSSSLNERLSAAVDLLKLEQSYHKQFDDLAEALYRTRFSANQMMQLATALTPAQIDENGKEIESTRSRNNRDTIIRLFEEGRGHRETEIVGTAWAAYNAVAEYVDHHRASRVSPGQDETTKRLESAYFGSGNQLKARSLDLIRQATGV